MDLEAKMEVKVDDGAQRCSKAHVRRLRNFGLAPLALPLAPLALAGCGNGCRRSTPYVPFLEDAATVAPRDDGGVQSSVDAGGSKPSFVAKAATVLPPGTTRSAVDGLSFEAPAGSVIVAALAHDLDGDGQKDVVAYVQPPGGGGGELRFHRGDGGGALLAGRTVGSATDLSLPSPCVAKPIPTLLALVGPHSVAVDLRPACGDAAPAPRRQAYAAFAPTVSIRWSARLPDPPPGNGWSFGLSVEARDEDGDGVDDPTFVFALEGGGPPWPAGARLEAKVPYFDRPAGLSRDRRYPEQSFQSIAAIAVAKAGKKGAPATVGPLVDRLRILHAALCTEGGAPWIEINGDRGVVCAPSKALEIAGEAEIRAALATGEPLRAIGARERLASDAVARTAKVRTEIDRLIRESLPVVTATARDLKALPSTPAKGAPAWGALAFERSGALLIRTSTSVVRVDPTTFAESEATDVPSWPWEVTLPGKDARLAGVVDPCDAPNLAARFSGHDVPTGSTLIALPMLPPMGKARCASPATIGSVAPVSFVGDGLHTLVSHEPVLIPSSLVGPSGARATGAPVTAGAVSGVFVLGSPRSPSGSHLVVPTRFGILRRDESTLSSALVVVGSLEGIYGSLRECAVADGGGRIACIRDNRAVLVDAGSAQAE